MNILAVDIEDCSLLKLSRYNLYWEFIFNGKRYYIVYNTLTKATVLLNDSFYETLLKEKIVHLENNVQEDRQILRYMKHLKMLVNSSLNEREEINLAIEKINKSKLESDNFTIWLYLTYDCNFDCPCYKDYILIGHSV